MVLIGWLIVAGVLGVVEMLTLTMAVAPFAGAALLAAGLAALGAPVVGQAAAFAVLGVALLIALRPVARRHQAQPTLTGVQALVGQEVQVLQDVHPDRPGLVEVRGSTWNAQAHQLLPAGAPARVVRVDGTTLHLEPLKGTSPT